MADEAKTLREGDAAAPSDELVPGTTLGRYSVLEKIGAGGMGVVYSAYDYGLDRRVALKLVAPRSAAGAHDRLLREAQAMAKLSHPSIVAVHDVGQLDGCVFVAMEFVDGPTLRDWMAPAGVRRPWRDILDMFVVAGGAIA